MESIPVSLCKHCVFYLLQLLKFMYLFFCKTSQKFKHHYFQYNSLKKWFPSTIFQKCRNHYLCVMYQGKAMKINLSKQCLEHWHQKRWIKWRRRERGLGLGKKKSEEMFSGHFWGKNRGQQRAADRYGSTKQLTRGTKLCLSQG